jgi:tRNA pseudouridine38-40 synthase
MIEDNAAAGLSNYRLTLAYDGRNYFGWQRHGDAPTVQGALEQALQATFGVRGAVHGSGRTDRGAHANGQVATVVLPAGIVAANALAELNRRLPEDIRIVEFSSAPQGFHARACATSKTYRYVIWNAPDCPLEQVGRVWHIPSALHVEAMRAACPLFLGELDFASFAKKPNFKQATTVRHIKHIELNDEAPIIEIIICADGFLYKMVRNIVRAIVKVGEGRTDLSQLKEIIAAKDRRAAPGTAPASGLFLEAVYFDAEPVNLNGPHS